MATATVLPIVRDSGRDFASKTVCVKVKFGVFGNSKSVNTSNITIAADKKLIKVKKLLLDSPELKAINKLDTSLRTYLYSKCLPFEVSIFLLPLVAVPQVTEEIEGFIRQRKKLVKKFLLAYPAQVKRAAERLNAVHNPADYPSLEELAEDFFFDYQYHSFGSVPEDMKIISPAIYNAEKKKAAKIVTEAADTVRDIMRTNLANMTKKLAGELVSKEDGSPNRFDKRAVAKMQDWLSSFEDWNVADDSSLKREVEKLRKVLDGVDVEKLRENDTFRDKIQVDMQAVSDKLATMVVAKPGRMIKLVSPKEM